MELKSQEIIALLQYHVNDSLRVDADRIIELANALKAAQSREVQDNRKAA